MPDIIDTYFQVIATFDQYPGNFQREVTEWVFGAADFAVNAGYTEDRPHAEAMAWAFDVIDGMEGALRFFPHDEYGLVPSDTLDAERLEFRLEADEEITSSQWNAMKWAFHSFTDRYVGWDGRPIENKPHLVKLEMNKVVTTRELERRWNG